MTAVLDRCRLRQIGLRGPVFFDRMTWCVGELFGVFAVAAVAADGYQVELREGFCQ